MYGVLTFTSATLSINETDIRSEFCIEYPVKSPIELVMFFVIGSESSCVRTKMTLFGG
jgi:hypothetical protein